MNNAKFYAYVKRSGGDGWGCDLKASTERAAKIEARKTFGGDYRDATIYLCEWYTEQTGERTKLPVAAARFSGPWSAI